MTTTSTLSKSLIHSLPVATRSQLIQDLGSRLLDDTETSEDQHSCLEFLCELALQPDVDPLEATEASNHAVQYSLRCLGKDTSTGQSFTILGAICGRWQPFATSLTTKLLDVLRSRIAYDSSRQHTDEAEHESSPQVKLHVVKNSLLMLKYLVWQSKSEETIPSESLLSCLLDLLVVTDERTIAIAAKTLAIDFIRTQHIEELDIWNKLKPLLEKHRDAPTIALQLWLHVILEKPNLFLAASPFEETFYWTTLQDQLISGTNECRRICLGILTVTLELLDHDLDNSRMFFKICDKPVILAQYAKFMTIYRAVILDRYLNQIHACLPELSLLVKSSSLVHPWWVVALLSAALRKGMQDSIRKIIGNWTLSFGHSILVRMGEAAAQLLQYQLLPWAAQGHFFTSTISGRNGVYTCAHGDRLMVLVRDLLLEASSPDDSLMFISVTIQYLEVSDNHIFAFARAYILEGLKAGSSSCPLRLTPVDTMRLIRIARRSGFQAIVNDYMLLLCSEILQRLGSNSSESMTGPSIASVVDETEQIRSGTLEPAGYEDHFLGFGEEFWNANKGQSRLEKFCLLLDSTQYRILHKRGLEASCSLLQEILDEDHSQVEAHHLVKAFKAVWDEVVIQDLPRKATIRYCQMLLHWKCIQLSATDKGMSKGLTALLADLYPLMQNKFYIFVQLSLGISAAMKVASEDLLGSFNAFLQIYVQSGAATGVEFALDAALGPKVEQLAPKLTFASYYGLPDTFGHAGVFDILLTRNRDPKHLKHAKSLLTALLRPWLRQKEPVPVFSRWKSTSQLQAILLLYEQLWPVLDAEEKQNHFDNMLWLLSIELLPRFRFLMEWTIARMCVKDVDRRRLMLEKQSKYDTANPKLAVSIMKVCQMVACLSDSTQDFAVDLAAQLAVLAGSAKVAMRHEAQWTIPRLWDEAQNRGWTRLLNDKVFRLLNEHIRTLDVYHDPPNGRLLNYFHPIQDHNISMLLEGDFCELDPQEKPIVRQADMVTLWNHKASNPADEALLMPLGGPRTDAPKVARRKVADGEPTGEDLVAPTIPLQTKATSLKDLAPIQQSLIDLPTTPRPRDIIVVASLIDTNYNVGGISRVSEIFGCRSLVVRNTNVIKSKDFTSVAVSSELWLPVKELDTKPGMIEDFLTERKLEGYTVVGIEQTDSSLVLGREGTGLPGKLVLVIGGEREGIPAHLLAQMDFCVEIEQAGITRSMNVQTAVAVVLYEYARQHPIS